MKEIELAGAKWCVPCKNTKDNISKVAYQMGANMTYHDLGAKEHLHRNLGDLKDRGYIMGNLVGIPMFFVDKKQIPGPTSLEMSDIYIWITDNYST